MKVYIFNLDGILLDSMGVWKQIDVDFLTKRDFQVPRDYINAICFRSFPEAAQEKLQIRIYKVNGKGFCDSVR